MPISELQRQERKKCIGSSDIPIVMGISPYCQPIDLWLEKCGLGSRKPAGELATVGTFFEDGILSWAETQLGTIVRNPGSKEVPGTNIAVNVDGLLQDPNSIDPVVTACIEAKFTLGWSGDWGAPGTDEVPEAVKAQCHGHMMAWGCKICWVPVLTRDKFGLYHVYFDEEYAQRIKDCCLAFWEHVKRRIPPEWSVLGEDTIKRLAIDDVEVTIDPTLLAEWREADVRAKETAKVAKDLREKMLNSMVSLDGTVATKGNGGEAGSITWKHQSRSSLDQARLKAEHPELIKEYMKQTSYPVLRYQKPAKEVLGDD